MTETAGLNFLRRLERRAQKLQGSIEVGTGDLNLIIRDYAQIEEELAKMKTYAQKLESHSTRPALILNWRDALGLCSLMSEWLIPNEHRKLLDA